MARRNAREPVADEPSTTIEGRGDEAVVIVPVVAESPTVKTLEQALSKAEVDLREWDVDHWTVNKWDVLTKKDVEVEGDPSNPTAWRRQIVASELWQVKVWLKRKRPQLRALEQLLEDLKESSLRIPNLHQRYRLKGKPRRLLEIDVFDPHLGLHCFPPGSDHAWSLEDCEQTFLWAIDELLKLAKPYYPIEKILFPIGNDFLHTDNLANKTTAGTEQPEATTYHESYSRGVKLMLAAVDALKAVAPVEVLQIPGNHDRQTSFSLGHVAWAYYHNDKNVQVDCSASPYKFCHYGTNLIGFEHGHSVRPIRLAALMANECPEAWSATTYREWHLGDQHRKGSSKPSMLEEQGVSVEYLTGLTPPNEWHRLKAFNWQKRGATGFVWDYHQGPMVRLQVNLNSYTGRPTGQKKRRNKT